LPVTIIIHRGEDQTKGGDRYVLHERLVISTKDPILSITEWFSQHTVVSNSVAVPELYTTSHSFRPALAKVFKALIHLHRILTPSLYKVQL
jgi:hypothetical protein